MTKIGAHVSIAGGIPQAIDRITRIGGTCLQMFSTSPRGWSLPDISQTDIDAFNTKKKRNRIDPIYFHASYLINMADDGETGEKSKKMLIAEMNLQPKIAAKGSVVHLGSYKKKNKKLASDDMFPMEKKETDLSDILFHNIYEVLKQTPSDSYLLIENAGMRKIGESIEEIADIMKSMQSDRIKVCLDTCHLHAAGYDLRTDNDFESFWDKFDSLIGLNKLELIHVNDSKDPFGSLRDRHENIGEGTVGVQVFQQLVNNPVTKDIPLILETPGYDGKGPDKQNVDILTSYIVL